jgi:hypothetical protein
MITAKREDKQITRNSSHFKRVGNSQTQSLNGNVPLNSEVEHNITEPIYNKTSIESQSDENTMLETLPTSNEYTSLRRSERHRKPPDYLKDYICK